MWSLLLSKFQKGACRYLLHRYLGQYLKEKVTVDQLTVDLYNGTGSVMDVSLDCDALNALAEQHSLPIQFIEGSLEEINFLVPWSTIMQESCEIQVKGLRITIQPKSRNSDNGSSMIDSMFTSMASSMQLAEECLKTGEQIEDDQHDPGNQEMMGLEHCAKTIDAILSRIKISFHDTSVRIERCHRGSDVGIALEFHIKLWKYYDDSTSDAPIDENNPMFDTAFSNKRITLEGVTCHSEIFSSKLHFARQRNASTASEEETGHEDEESEDERHCNTVQVAKFSGLHEIKLQVKTDDSIAGPQVSVDCNFGSIIGFLTPIQAHILYIIVNEIIDPSQLSHEGILGGKNCSEKPMDSYDFKRVERELQERAKPENIGVRGLAQQQGWSSACYDDSDEEFLPMKGRAMYASTASNFMNSSIMTNSSVTTSMQQSMTDSLNLSTYKSAYNYSSSQANVSGSNGADKTKFAVSFASVSLLLLHEDILSLSATDVVFPETLQQLQTCSRKFFETLYYFGATVKGEKDIADVREKMNAACDLNHHRIIAAPLKIKGHVRNNVAGPTHSETAGTVAIGYFELIESLKDKGAAPTDSTPNPQCIEVLTFPRFEHNSMQAMKLDFKSESRKGRGNNSLSKTSLKFSLNDCLAEVDISLVDRVNSLINSPLYFYIEPKEYRDPAFLIAAPIRKNQSVVKINVKCPKISVDFRFPIPDLRPVDDINHIPYWVRNVHKDSVVVQLNEMDFATIISTKNDVLEFDTKCHEAKLFYKQTPTDTPILFATAMADDPEVDGMSLRSQGLDWPRLVVCISPKRTTLQSEIDITDESESMDTMTYMSMPQAKPSPFSSRRIVHEVGEGAEDQSNQESESVIPGDRAEMNEFVEDTNKSVMYRIDMNFRFVEVSLPSKHFFEELYNRVGNDLLLWEASCIKPPHSRVKDRYPIKTTANAAFSMCKSAIRFDPDSEDEGDVTAFYTPSRDTSIKQGPDGKVLRSGQSEVTLSLSIGKGIGSFYTPLQDAMGNTVPGQKGQMAIKIEQGNLFFVSGYKGETNLGYICLVSHKAELHHADLVRNTDIRSFGEMVKTIYPSEEGMLPNRAPDSSSSDMLYLAIKIDRDVTKNLKTFKVALGIREGTLHHQLYLPNRTWFTQMTDFFDVTDMPILGYTPSTVLTELHFHLWNCCVDYRPLHLPLRSVLAIETFSISSNVAAQTSTNILRFLSEDAAFFITTKPKSTNLKDDYVCVMDMDYFELCLRLCSNRNSSAPRIDLSTSSNALHIRTCSDSFKTLLELLTYYTNDGDLYDPQQRDSESVSLGAYSPIQEAPSEPALIPTEEITEGMPRKLSECQTEHVNDLVAEAMEETSVGKNDAFDKSIPKPIASKPMYDLHFAPDYSSEFQFKEPEFCAYDAFDECETPMPIAPIMETSNGLPVDIQPSDEDEEEFCILENDPGVGIISKNGEPEARILTDEPIRLIENYFSPPVGKLDALKAPKHYPNPVQKYTLKEMSIIWHLYGGDDFGLTPTRKMSGRSDEQSGSDADSWKEQNFQNYYETSEVDVAIDPLNPGAVFSKTKAFESAWEAYESPKNPNKSLPEGCRSWRQQGGKGRRHDILVQLHLNKIKCVHEIYPDTTEQASRQVMIINNVEILDKLRSSQFNKMLYLYTTPSRPKQTHANMVMVKAAHIRPDPQICIEECCLKIAVLPIRLNIDQDALLFLHQYFSDLSAKPDSEDEDSASGRLTNPPSHTPSVESLPVMNVNVGENEGPAVTTLEEETSNLLMFNDDALGMEDDASTCSRDPSIDSSKSNAPVYFRQVIFAPEVPIRLDYRGKRMDMTHGPLAGVLMGLAQLNCSEIRLKQIYHRHGILGIDRLLAFLINEWAQDIKKNQLPSLLGGVGPIHSFIQLFQGVRDLFWLPIEQYQKDGRIGKGLQRGVNAFSTSTAMAALELTNKLIQTIQGAAEFTYDLVSPGPSLHQKRRQTSSKRRKRHHQPGDIREGMANAYSVVREGLGETAHTIVRVASKEHEQKGLPGAVGGVLRQIPPTVVRPIILVAEATSNVLDGFRSQLEPEFKKENQEKWKET